MSEAASTGAVMSIGEVLEALRPEFPDVTISKIRFLESEGLVEPARTPAGYRKFSHADVSRLHYVLASQRDHYLPLRVIKEHLDAVDRGLEPSAAPGERPRASVAAENPNGLPGPRTLRAPTGDLRLSRSELLTAAGIDASLLDQIQEFGLVTPARRRGKVEHFDQDALMIATAVAEMAAFGLEPRHLRAFRSASDREVDLVAAVVGPLLRQRSPQARANAEEVAREMGALALRLHAALVRSRMRGILGP